MPKRPDIYWLEQTDADVPLDNSWMSPAEQTQFCSMRFPKRQADWRLGRWTAKRAIELLLELHPDSFRLVEVRPRSSGAPAAFINNRPAPLSISLSHRGGVAICALAAPGTPLGCDIELTESRTPGFVGDYFTTAEQQLIRRTGAEDQDGVITLLWSAKESALKALETGLSLPTQSIEVCAPESFYKSIRRTWNPLEIRYQNDLLQGWWQYEGRFVRTVVVSNRGHLPRSLLARLHPHSENSIVAA